MDNIINFEELREGVAPNQEYSERIADVVNCDEQSFNLEATYEMFQNLQNVALEALLLGEKNLFVEIAVLDEESKAILRYLMLDETQCVDAGLIATMRSVLEFAPFNVAFKKVSKQDIVISQMTDVLNHQKSLYIVKENFKGVVIDMFDLAKMMLEDENVVENESENGKYSQKTSLDGNTVRKKEYVDQYTSCYNFSKEETSDLMYN